MLWVFFMVSQFVDNEIDNNEIPVILKRLYSPLNINTVYI
jgi:hypothetical protein